MRRRKLYITSRSFAEAERIWGMRFMHLLHGQRCVAAITSKLYLEYIYTRLFHQDVALRGGT